MSRHELLEELLAARCAWEEADTKDRYAAERRYQALVQEACKHTKYSERQLNEALKARFREYMRKRDRRF